ncbi:MAG: Mrp/NBP35 family ATP-binding protein [Parachlamydiaceae bacterium]
MPLKLYQERKNRIEHVLAIAAGKGGVGKSTITVDLALALKEKGYQVGILDADIYGPSIRKMLPPDLMPTKRGEKLLPAVCLGIKVMSIAYFRNQTDSIAVRAPIANGLIQQFVQNVDWGDLDFLLIDFPPGTGDVQLTLAQKAQLNAAIIVTTPQEVALMDVRKAMHLFDQVKVPCLGVVENMSYYWNETTSEKIFLFGREGGKLLASEKGIPFLGEIPLDPLIGQCLDHGISIFANEDNKGPQQVFMQLAKEVEARLESLRIYQEEAVSCFDIPWKEIPT